MKTGFVAMIGRPNAGKSTLLNQILDRKVAIVSDKPQTTRNRITGILTTEEAQIIYVDTPGIHKPHHKLGEFMVETAESTLYDVDVVYYLVDASQAFGKGEQYVLEQVEQAGVPAFLLLNKMDLLTPEKQVTLLTQWQQRGEFAEVFPISALKGNNVAELVDVTIDYLEEGPMYYPEDAVTDQPKEIVIAEMIREKILLMTHDEVPHSIAVTVEDISRQKDGKLHINAAIYVERQSQKGIIIGKQGTMLRKIGSQARRDIEYLLGEKIYLELWVKVNEDWRNKRSVLKTMGYEKDEEF